MGKIRGPGEKHHLKRCADSLGNIVYVSGQVADILQMLSQVIIMH